MKPSRKKVPWNEYFMGIAREASQRSPDPDYQVGAVIASKNNRVISTGCNGFPEGFNESSLDWDKKEELRPFIVHAERNAILYAWQCLREARLYCTLCPCEDCVLLARAAGIKEIYYADSYKRDEKIYEFCKALGVNLYKI